MSSTSPRTIFVLGGGGALGAFQAGALAALLEAGIVPDALVGCSVGALNAAFLGSDPTPARAVELAAWWAHPRTHTVIAPSRWGRLVGLVGAVRGSGLFDDRPLRRLIAANVLAHDIAELAVPLTVTTTCLDCGSAVHHRQGAAGDVLAASCALPGIFPAVRLADGHRHVDGGVLCGVPTVAALADAGPEDRVYVLDCALAPVTGRVDECAAFGPGSACGLAPVGRRTYVAPVETRRGALDVMLSAFTAARSAANHASVAATLDDPRVRVVPHVADAWAAGLLDQLPTGPRDCARTADLLRAGRRSTEAWLGTPVAAADGQ